MGTCHSHCTNMYQGFSSLVIAFILLSCVCAQNQGEYEVVRVLDDFEVETDPLILVVPPQAAFPIRGGSSIQNENIIGGERDLYLVVEQGVANSLMTAQVADGNWESNAPSSCSGFSSIIYNGVDGGLTQGNNIPLSGLDCIDLTEGGAADSFIIEARSSTTTDFKFLVYNAEGSESALRIQVEPSTDFLPYYIPFSQFQGSVDFTCVGAVQITPTVKQNSQFYVSILLVGRATVVQPSHSPTRTPTRTPSSIAPFASSTPTPSSQPNYECLSDLDCEDQYCTVGVCDERTHTCGSVLKHDSSCCAHASDCPYRECYNAFCSGNVCGYTSINCWDNSPSNESKGGSKLWIMGVVFGALFIVCIVLAVLVLIGWRVKKSRENSHSAYDAMIGLD